MITEYLMSLGGWDLTLAPTTPRTIRDKFVWGGNVFVTPARVTDPSITVGTLDDLAVYAGLILRKGHDQFSIGGPGLLGYLQTGQASSGSGGPTAIAASLPCSFATLLGLMHLNGLTVGTAYSASGTTVNTVDGTTFSSNGQLYNYPTKPVIDSAAAQSGNEYRVLPTGAIDYGISTALFRSTPNIILSPQVQGGDVGVIAYPLRRWEVTQSLENLRTSAVVEGQAAAGNLIGDSSTGSPNNIRRYKTASYATYLGDLQYFDTAVAGDLTALAVPISNEYHSVEYQVECEIDEFCIPRRLIPGDWVNVYDPDNGLTDATNQVEAQGRAIFPKKLRCVGYEWPVQSGMGVYVYDVDAATPVTDVTDYVRWEADATTRLHIQTKPTMRGMTNTPRTAKA